MIRAEQVSKSFRHRVVLQQLDLEAGPGCMVLLGPNGAGKTTLLRILAGLARPESGSVSLDGTTLAEHPLQYRRAIGFFSHQPLLYADLSPLQNLQFFSRLYALPAPGERIHTLLEQAGLQPRAHDPVRSLSHGYQQRLALLRALLHDPAVLLLDEPTRGLDTEALQFLDSVLQQARAAGKTIVLTTHQPEILQCPVDRTLQLRQGKLHEQAAAAVRGGSVHG